MTVAEAYRVGRSKARWTNNDIVERVEGKLKACAIGAFGIGMGIIDPSDVDENWVRGLSGLPSRLAAREAFMKRIVPESIPYECDCNLGSDLIPYVLEHWSDEHRRTLGSDKNLIAAMEKYERN